MDFKKLSAPFDVSEIQWRVGRASERDGKTSGLALAYYDARALYDRLDEVCGHYGWQIRYPHANGKTCCEIGIKIGEEWIWKANGAGDTDFEAEKGAFSDAAKRAGVPWGIGRYLYEMKNMWVECEKKGNSTVIKTDQYDKLNMAYNKFIKDGVKPDLSPVADGNKRSGSKAVDKAVDDALQFIRDCVDEESANKVGRHQWKFCKDSGATQDQLDIIQDQVTNHLEYLKGKR